MTYADLHKLIKEHGIHAVIQMTFGENFGFTSNQVISYFWDHEKEFKKIK